MSFIGLLVFDCVLHGLLSFCWYLSAYCMGFSVLLLCACVLHGLHCFVDISVCIAWVNRLLLFDCVLHGFYRFDGI